jgi:hypothetical protein
MPSITREMIRDFMNEALPDDELAMVEKAIREQPAIAEMVRLVREEHDRGEHSLGAIWRRERLSCVNREQLGSYLLDALDPELQDYITFHLKTVGCPHCQANLDDLMKKQADTSEPVKKRRQRILKSTAGVLQNLSGK